MDSADSGLYRLASAGGHLDALTSITQEMSLLDRSNLILLDKLLHEHWCLGQNVMLNWMPRDGGICVLIVPHYALAGYMTQGSDPESALKPSEPFLQSLLSGHRRIEAGKMAKVSHLLGIEPTFVPLRAPIPDGGPQQEVIERMIKRYSISYTPFRAVALFDIVGFSLLSPLEQMLQLTSLSYSLNSAQSKLSTRKMDIDFARSTTGDGFYVWNRDLTLDANINLFHLMHLALADNAIARGKSHSNSAPRLRACFHIGGSYEFHQPEGLNPTIYAYIVGDVTIELARMIERALPDQIMVGDFKAEMPFQERKSPGWVMLDSIDFVARATQRVAQLRGLTLSGDRVDYIRCYLTGARLNDGEFTIRRILVKDKHGRVRSVYNSKANIYRRNAEPLLLGIEDRVISADLPRTTVSEHVVRRAAVKVGS